MEKQRRCTSQIFLFWKFRHTDLCKTYWEIFKYHEIMKNSKIAYFLGQFSIRNTRILQTKNISWRSAWKKKDNVHLRWFFLETLSHRFVENILRDFQISWNYEKYEICPFSRSIFYQKWLKMPNKKYLLRISMENWRKCTSGIFDFGNFITEIFWKHSPKVIKCQNYENWAFFRAIFPPRNN